MKDNLKQIIKRYFPCALIIPVFFIFLSDFIKYVKYSGLYSYQHNEKKLMGRIMADAHIIEKGLILSKLQTGFDLYRIINLTSNIEFYMDQFDSKNNQIKSTVGVLLDYIQKYKNFSLDDRIISRINHLKERMNFTDSANYLTVSMDQYFKDSNSDFYHFSNSRRSIRTFSKTEIPIEKIKEAVSLARNAPSSCNRQGVRVYAFEDREKIRTLLSIQAGSESWGEITNKLLIVTSDICVSHGVNERNQALIDGGIFSMNLLYSLHYYEIASCALNCSFDRSSEKKVLKSCNIPESEALVMFIACGLPATMTKLLKTNRKDLGKYFIY